MNEHSRFQANRIMGRIAYDLFLAVCSVCFLLLFASATSPLIRDDWGFDSAFFILVGRGMREGMLPYRDFFDMKGPYLFMIEFLGQVLCDGRTGAFILECISLFVSLLLADRVLEMQLEDVRGKVVLKIAALLGCLVLFAETMQGGNLTEEYSLPFLLLGVWLFFRYTLLAERTASAKHPIWYAFFYGAIIGILTFIRITNAALIGALILPIALLLISKKEYQNLLQNLLMGIAGFLAALILPCVFFGAHGLLSEMLHQVFVFGVKYSSKTPFIEKLKGFPLDFSLYLLFPFVVSLLFSCKWYLKLASLFSAAFLMIALSMGNAYLHYFVLLIPNFVFGLGILMHGIKCGKQKPGIASKLRAACAILVLIASFGVNHNSLQREAVNVGIANYHQIVRPQRSMESEEIAEIKSKIPEDEQNSFFIYAIRSASNWYAQAGLFPANRYCDWQEYYIHLVPEIGDELAGWIRENGTKWILTNREYRISPECVQAAIEEHYSVFYQSNQYLLLKRK